MEEGIAIVSVSRQQELVRLLNKAQSINVTYHPVLPSQSSLTELSVVILSTSAQDVERVLDSINILRSERMYLGTIVVISFMPRKWFLTQEDGVLINTKGCDYIQLPFLVEDFSQLISRRVRLSHEELSDVRRLLRASRFIKNAGYIGHKYKNKFARALAHLREVEKLSYYNPPQVELVADEVETLKGSLTREKVHELHAAVTHLLESASGCLEGSISRSLLLADDYWMAFEPWFDLVEEGNGVIESDLVGVFTQAKRVQLAIREILKLIASLKDDAQQVVNHA